MKCIQISISIYFLYLLANYILVFLLKLSGNQIVADNNFFLGFYSNWETLLVSEGIKLFVFILFGLCFWWYEKRNHERNDKLDD